MAQCIACNAPFEISENEQQVCARLDVPVPAHCPECRLIRRLQERNARKLYYRTCDLTEKTIISMYHREHEFPVYGNDAWWSDDWDPIEYGVDFDFSRSFFEQFHELMNRTPHFSASSIGGSLENSDYTNCAGYLKNCYLISESDYDEDCMYSNRIYHCKNVIDCTNCYECELCYEAIDCNNCYQLLYSEECENCHDSYFLKNCIGCNDCIGCMNQRHKQYMIFNEQYSKEEYLAKKEALALHTHAGRTAYAAKAQELFQTLPQRATEGEHNENVIGDHVYNSKNAFYCFDAKNLEDCMYCVKTASNVKNCIDYTSWGFDAEHIYQCGSCGDNVYNLAFCSTCITNNANLMYCMQCSGCSDCFGCFGLKSEKHCIFNTQYSKEEYEELRARIIMHMKNTPLKDDPTGKLKEWGQFFPNELLAFGYNETIAMDCFPLTKEEALSRGYKWSDHEDPLTGVVDTLSADSIPERIEEIDEHILQSAILCEVSGKPYKVTEQELEFYRKLNIPCPRKCYNERHANRMAKRPEYRLTESTCSHCNKPVFCNITKLPSSAKLCDDCYAKVVY